MDERRDPLSILLNLFQGSEGLNDLLKMSEHCNGYKRENAVRRLGMLGNPLAIPALLVRVNDWVPQVRAAAAEALNKLMLPANARAYVSALPYVYRLDMCSRADHSALINQIERFLLQQENVHAVLDGLADDSGKVRRRCFRLAIEHRLLDPATLVFKGLSTNDVLVRYHVSSLFRVLTGHQLRQALEIGLHDPLMPVRREAFQVFLRSFPSGAESLARASLFDRHHSIREIAIRYLVKNGFDVSVIYSMELQRIQTSVHLTRCAVLGLAELDDKTQIDRIIQFRRSPFPGVRRACLAALVKLDLDGSRPWLIEGLLDESPGVIKASGYLLHRHRITVGMERLISIACAARHEQSIRACLAVAERGNKWEWLIFILSLFSDMGRLVLKDSQLLIDKLRDWDRSFNRSSTQPSADQLQRLEDLGRVVKNKIGAERYRSLAFTLRTHGIEPKEP